MFMDARTRRIAACLGEAQGKYVKWSTAVDEKNAFQLDTSKLLAVDLLGNSVTFEMNIGSGENNDTVSIPIDYIDAVWRDKDTWRMIIRGRFDTFISCSPRVASGPIFLPK